MTTKIITFIVVGFIVLLITLVYLRSQANKQGRLVEKQDARKACRVMGRKIKRIALFRRWTVLKGVSLRTKKRTAFIDFLIIAPFGLLALSVRGEKGQIYAGPNDAKWLHVNGPNKDYIPNLIDQNRAIQEDLRWVLSTEKIYKVPIYTLAVFTERKLELYFPINEGDVLLKSRLRKELKKYKYRAELPIASDRILDAVEKYRYKS